MLAYIIPVPAVRQHHSTVICVARKPQTRSIRARSRANRKAATSLPDIPEVWLQEINRLVRTHSFTQRVTECLSWPHVRFTGKILPLPTVESEEENVVPEIRYPFHCITLPPGLLKRACKASKSLEELANRRLCAVFETYGESDKRVMETVKEMNIFEKDIRNQLLAWSDRGHCMRTETDLTDLKGPELMHERYLDYLD